MSPRGAQPCGQERASLSHCHPEERSDEGSLSPERQRVTVGGPLRANNSEVLRDAVVAGLGIGLLPDFSAAAALRAGRLRELLPGWRPVGFFGDAVWALRPWSPQLPRAVRALVDHLKAALAGGFGGVKGRPKKEPASKTEAGCLKPSG